MDRNTRRSRALRRIATANAVVLVVGLSWGGIATALDDDSTMHGCINKRSGALRVVADPGQCSNSETAVSWNKRGPAGPAGADGAAGPEGPTGPAGPTGPQGPAGQSALGTVYAGSFTSDGLQRPGGTPGMTTSFSTSVFDGYRVTVPVDLSEDPNGLTDCSAVATPGGNGGGGSIYYNVTSLAEITAPRTVAVVFADTQDGTAPAAVQTAFSLVVVCL